jgi:hypothetical protein
VKLVVTRDGAVRFEVHAKPRARKSRIAGVHGGALVVHLAAPPVDGAANAELVELLATALSLPKRDVRLDRGASGRVKLIEVYGLGAEEVRVRLGVAAVPR